MPELLELLRRGGGSSVSFGLRIEGEPIVFVNDPARSILGTYGWTPSTDHVSRLGLVADRGIVTGSRADWRAGRLHAEGMTLVVRDTSPAAYATQVFGGRQPARRTFLRSSIGPTNTVLPVVSTTGWPSSGVAHIGREAIYYESTDADDLLTCTRGHLGTVACAHAAGGGAIEVTDVPAALERRRAELYLFIDGADSDDADIIWRGIVRGVRELGREVGYEITLGPVADLLEQDVGAAIQPFGIRGYYFSTIDAFDLVVDEWSLDAFVRPDGNVAYRCDVRLSGHFETLDELAAAVTEQLRDPGRWQNVADDTTGNLPVNPDYTCEVLEGALVVTVRAHGTTPKAAVIRDSHPLFVGATYDTAVTESETGAIGGLTAYAWEGGRHYTIRAREPVVAPLAYSRLGMVPRGRVLIGDVPFPGNRIYYASGAPTTATRLRVREDDSVSLVVVRVDTGEGFYEVEWDRVYGFFTELIATSEEPVQITPTVDFGTGPWTHLLRQLIERTPTTGTTGDTPWLPSIFFDLDEIERVSRAAGDGAFISRWSVGEPTSLRKLFEPYLQLLGLSWVVTFDGRLKVAMIDVSTPSAFASATYTDRSGDWARMAEARSIDDGVVNLVRVKSGYDPQTRTWRREGNGAYDECSADRYGRQTLALELLGGDLLEPSRDLVLRDGLAGARLVATHAAPYVHLTLSGIPGLQLAAVEVGSTISVTDQRVPWRGVRGAVVPGQVTRQKVRWYGPGAPGVDLEVRLSDWDSAGYAPCARIVPGGLGGAGSNRLTMRAENRYSRDGDPLDYLWFPVGCIVRVRELDADTYNAASEVTITAVDTVNHYLTTDTDFTGLGIDDADRLFVVETDAIDFIPDEDPQRRYAFIANATHLIETGMPARRYAA